MDITSDVTSGDEFLGV